ncbi:SgcJ/EcaC family oxidoreductase [Arthrobacter sp. KNU-44]|uniref:SgcJ/EcaC family oxidoreductase n=1 Tax=Arthrobacter sp. KNU-44 TaxID=3450744 RepID=UPI003F43BAE1
MPKCEEPVMPRAYHRNKGEIRSSMAAGFQGPLKGSRAVDEPLSIRVIGDHTAIVVSRAGILMAGEAQLPVDREVIATWVLVREDGRWLVASYANAPAH